MEVVLGPDEVVVLLPRPDVGPAAGVSQPKKVSYPCTCPAWSATPRQTKLGARFYTGTGEMKSNLEYQS